MEMLLTAVDRGSLSAAARELKIPVSTLTRKAADLEELLGTRLLIRTTRKLTLTDAGMSYVAAARRILDLVREQEHEATGEFATAKGELVVTAPVQLGRLHVLPVINQFLAQYPDITVRLLLSDRNIDLIDSHVDLALRIGELADTRVVLMAVRVSISLKCDSLSDLKMKALTSVA
jgi:DNA-binding transcriptional LysR family regulator